MSVDVNGFLGYATRGQLAPTVDNFVALSATIAAHELGHLAGLRHVDAFGPIGSGVYLPDNAAAFLPGLPGPAAAADTPLHVMSSPASTRSDLIAAAGDTFFGVREAVKLAFADTGTVTAETGRRARRPTARTPRASRSPWQPDRVRPEHVSGPAGVGRRRAGARPSRAADVVGAHRRTRRSTGPSENDWYSFAGHGRARWSPSRSCPGPWAGSPTGSTRSSGCTRPDGNLVAYQLRASPSADGRRQLREPGRPLLDLPLPADGTYYVEVDTFTSADDRGRRRRPVRAVPVRGPAGGRDRRAERPAGTSLLSQPGDTVIASSGRDKLFADGGEVVGKVVAAAGPVPVRHEPDGVRAGAARTSSWARSRTPPRAGRGRSTVNWGDRTPATRFTATRPAPWPPGRTRTPRTGRTRSPSR